MQLNKADLMQTDTIQRLRQCVAIKYVRWPNTGWHVASYDWHGYASHGTTFADKQGARRFAKWLATRSKPVPIVECE